MQSKKKNIFATFLHTAKEYILVIATFASALAYLVHYFDEIAGEAYLIRWLLYALLFIIILLLYFFTLRPELIKQKELNFKPKGEADLEYFTTFPRTHDKYNFFSSGYEKYVKWVKTSKSPILYLTGSSGSGKSSLIAAYLSPKLKASEGSKVRIYTLGSFNAPFKTLYEALTRGITTLLVDEKMVFKKIVEASETLSPEERMLIIFDQFEEFFLLDNAAKDFAENAEKDQGIHQMKAFLHLFINNPPNKTCILLSYRDDFQQFIDQLELPARIEHHNFEQLNLLNLNQASKFFKKCPGLKIPQQQLNRVLREASTIDSPLGYRPIVLNLLGVILQRMAINELFLNSKGNLIRDYINDCLGKTLQHERATVLKAMLTDFSTSRPRTIEELVKFSKMTLSQLDNQMLIMQRFGLVRCVDNENITQSKRKWQIAHDFIATQIEKEVYGFKKNLWQNFKLYIAPLLMSLLISFSLLYFSNIKNSRRLEAILNVEKAGFVWTEHSKTLRNSVTVMPGLSDSLFQSLIPDFSTLQVETLVISFSGAHLLHAYSADSNILNQKVIQFTSIAGLGKVNSLKEIQIQDNLELRDIGVLKDLNNLRSLTIRDCDKIQNVNELKNCNLLTRLDLNGCIGLNDLEGISHLDSLKYLDLNGCKSIKNMDGLNGLKKLGALNELRLTMCDSLNNINGLKDLKSLTVLQLVNDSSLTDFSGLIGLKSLETLELSNNENLKNIDAIRNLKKLKALYLNSCHNLKDISGLKGLEHLTTLNLVECFNISDFSALKGLSALTSLNLQGCGGLTDISALKGLVTLTELDLQACSSITSDQIAELKKALPNTEVKSYY